MILGGARTLSGALIPLKGSAPINYNFTDTDYKRSGLKGNGKDKYIDTQFKYNSVPRNDRHHGVYLQESFYTKYEGQCNTFLTSYEYFGGPIQSLMGHCDLSTYDDGGLADNITILAGRWSDINLQILSCVCADALLLSIRVPHFRYAHGFWGLKRIGDLDSYYSRAEINEQKQNEEVFFDIGSSTPTAATAKLFCFENAYNNTRTNWCSGRISFFSSGSALNLGTLKSRVTTLMSVVSGLAPQIPVQSKYVTHFVPLEVTTSGLNYNISQYSNNNPTLTCFRGTNYDFIVNGLTSHPFALIAGSLDTVTQISGAYNNDTNNGRTSGRILFTPNQNTPNTIYYQCAVHSSMIGTIYIKDY